MKNKGKKTILQWVIYISMREHATVEGCLENLRQLTRGGERIGRMRLLVILQDFCGPTACE